jgi:hypothetical protein
MVHISKRERASLGLAVSDDESTSKRARRSRLIAATRGQAVSQEMDPSAEHVQGLEDPTTQPTAATTPLPKAPEDRASAVQDEGMEARDYTSTGIVEILNMWFCNLTLFP